MIMCFLEKLKKNIYFITYLSSVKLSIHIICKTREHYPPPSHSIYLWIETISHIYNIQYSIKLSLVGVPYQKTFWQIHLIPVD